MDLLKSMVLELVIMLCRAAVEAGAEPSELLGVNYHSVTELASIKDEKALSDWLAGMLERQMEAVRDNQKYPNTVLLGKALAYMKEHIGAKLGRNDVARNAGLSPSHFSHLMKEQLDRTFTEQLGQYRIDHARERLIRTSLSIAEIASECGFSDQSYFCKVFHRYTGMTPSGLSRTQFYSADHGDNGSDHAGRPETLPGNHRWSSATGGRA